MVMQRWSTDAQLAAFYLTLQWNQDYLNSLLASFPDPRRAYVELLPVVLQAVLIQLNDYRLDAILSTSFCGKIIVGRFSRIVFERTAISGGPVPPPPTRQTISTCSVAHQDGTCLHDMRDFVVVAPTVQRLCGPLPSDAACRCPWSGGVLYQRHRCGGNVACCSSTVRTAVHDADLDLPRAHSTLSTVPTRLAATSAPPCSGHVPREHDAPGAVGVAGIQTQN
jgi:hypothetical protein